jgi:hypothetical protein
MSTVEVDLRDYEFFDVTGVTVYGKRFKLRYSATRTGFYTAFGINLYQGSVWGVKSNGKRVLLNRVYN